MAKKENSLAHTKWMCKYHIVFAPKYRRKVIYNQYKEDIRDIIKQLCGYKGVEIIEGHLMPDHIHRAVQPDFVEMESDLALIAVVGRGMKSQRGTAGRVFSALAHAHVNVKMIDQGSSELNIIIGVENRDFETAVKAIYDIFVLTQM